MTVVVTPFTKSLTVTLTNGTLPQLVTIPLKGTGCPGQTGPGPQILVTAMQGVVQTVQLAVTAGRGPVFE